MIHRLPINSNWHLGFPFHKVLFLLFLFLFHFTLPTEIDAAKKLSESIKIMSLMKKNAHIDPDLFDLFLSSGVYKDYAERFLEPAQIDEIDITQYIKKKFRKS